MRTFVTVFAVVSNLLLADAVTKEMAAARLRDAAAVSVVPGFFSLAYVENRGCAWGMLQGSVWPLAAFAAAALAFLVWKRRDVFQTSAHGWRRVCGVFAEPLIYAGILGNLIDRVWRGYVIDFLDFHLGASHFPCFNLADVYISVAAALLVAMSCGTDPRRSGAAAA